MLYTIVLCCAVPLSSLMRRALPSLAVSGLLNTCSMVLYDKCQPKLLEINASTIAYPNSFTPLDRTAYC
jgi:hypothetical protein